MTENTNKVTDTPEPSINEVLAGMEDLVSDKPGKIILAADEFIEVVTMGDLEEGDVLVGPNGRVTIEKSYDPHIPESMFELETDSGITIQVSGNHLFYVITKDDRELHRLRLSTGKKLGKKLDPESVQTLEDVANGDQVQEVYIAEFKDFIKPMNKEMNDAILRVAESLGPVAEQNRYVDDLEDSEAPLYESSIPLYNSQLFARQLLSVFNIGKYRKKWPVIIGSVMPASSLTAYDPRDIYIPDPAIIEEKEGR